MGDFFRKAGPMGVKVVPFILFALAGECLSLTERQKQVDDVLFKMSDKLIGIEKKLSSIEDRISVLENSQTKPKENKQTNLEDSMKNLRSGGVYRNMDTEIQKYESIIDKLANLFKDKDKDKDKDKSFMDKLKKLFQK